MRSSRAPPDMDLMDTIKGAASAGDVPESIVESLTGMVLQLGESQKAALQEIYVKQCRDYGAQACSVYGEAGSLT